MTKLSVSFHFLFAAVDMWSAGVIFLSLLSGRYPFFRGNDDMTCLSQIISLLGTEKVARAAASFGQFPLSNLSSLTFYSFLYHLMHSSTKAECDYLHMVGFKNGHICDALPRKVHKVAGSERRSTP